MRILLTFMLLIMLSGCTAMLLGGSATTERPSECEQDQEQGSKRDC